jgi:hypothetical protein
MLVADKQHKNPSLAMRRFSIGEICIAAFGMLMF